MDTDITVNEITKDSDNINVKAELSRIGVAIELTDRKIKASFKSIKNLMRNQHFQTHIQFPTESLILHLEQFLYHPSNATEDDLKLTCTKTLPTTILKSLELMLKDKFLIHQCENDLEIFEKLEKGIVLMVKQLIFTQSVCLQIRRFGAMEIPNKIVFNMVNNIEHNIKKQKMEVQIKFQLAIVFANTLNNDNNFTVEDFQNHNASLNEMLEKNLCQKTESVFNNGNVDFFFSRESTDFTVITKNRYIEESYNGWNIFAFYPKTFPKKVNRIKNEVDPDGDNVDEEIQQRSKKVVKNQILFKCMKNDGHCSLTVGNLGGIFSDGMGKHLHFVVCGNVAVTLGNPNNKFQNVQDGVLTEEEKAEFEKWEKINVQIKEYLKNQKAQDLKAEKKRENRKKKFAEKLIAKSLKEMKEKKEVAATAAAMVSTNNGINEKSSSLFLIFVFAFYYSIF
uniref:Uncharacterized protein n=1 Tax=Panagrolaimus sp. ES5 TaxID=591445 RepID=A0AC34F5C4_9BILA